MSGADKELYFDKSVTFKFDIGLIRDAEKIVRIAQDEDLYQKYDNLSHFIRCAIIKLISEERRKIKLIRFVEDKKENGSRRVNGKSRRV